MNTFLKGRRKLGHLDRTSPKSNDIKFGAWDEEDSMIMSWLWNSKTLEISSNCMFLLTAKEICNTMCQTYLKMKDYALIYELKTKVTSTKQGSQSITEYYNLLKGYWL